MFLQWLIYVFETSVSTDINKKIIIEHGSKIEPIMIGMYLSDMRKFMKKYFIYLFIYYANSNIADLDYWVL